MPRVSTVITLFLASPSDVAPERAIVTRVIDDWNAIEGRNRNVLFELLSWERNTSSSIGDDGQDVINGQIGDSYDAMIALFWTKVGMETERAVSGSVEEYERALARHNSGDDIEIGVYFKTAAPSLDMIKPSQYQGVLDLKDRIEADGVYHKSFVDDISLDFEIKLFLDRISKKLLKSTDTKLTVTTAIPISVGAKVIDEHSLSGSIEGEDLGYLDLIESMQEHSEKSSEFLDGMSKELGIINSVVTLAADQLKELASLGVSSPKNVRPVVTEVTSAFDDFSVYIESGIESFAVHTAGLAEDGRKLVNVASDFDPAKDDIEAAEVQLLSTISAMSGAVKAMQEFAGTIASLQRMTVKFNHARRRLSANVRRTAELIISSRSILQETVYALS